MKKQLFEKKCIRCRLIFKTDNEKDRVCPSCKKATKDREKAKYKSTKPKPPPRAERKTKYTDVRGFVNIIDRYNKEHNTNYGYGQFVLLLEQGVIKI